MIWCLKGIFCVNTCKLIVLFYLTKTIIIAIKKILTQTILNVLLALIKLIVVEIQENNKNIIKIKEKR